MDNLFLAGEPKKLKQFSIETPVGKLESDSGNHFVDVISVLGVVIVIIAAKVLITKYFPWGGGE